MTGIPIFAFTFNILKVKRSLSLHKKIKIVCFAYIYLQKSCKSDVALQNKSPPKSHIQPVLLGISDSFKKESPCYHRLVSLQIDSRPSQVVTLKKTGKSDVALQNYANNFGGLLFCNATSDLPGFW